MTATTPPLPADLRALGLAVAAHPGTLPTRQLQRLLSAAEAARAVLFEVRREVPGLEGSGARGAGDRPA
jgi:hypothetical protein